jgi:hypothetical protein
MQCRYGGTDYNAAGSPYALYGYRLSANTLSQLVLPNSPSGSITFATQRLGASGLQSPTEWLVRGAGSMGARVPQVDPQFIVGNMPADCGAPMPSPDRPSPLAVCANCHYYSGANRIHANTASF